MGSHAIEKLFAVSSSLSVARKHVVGDRQIAPIALITMAIDVTDSTFETDVFERSKTNPVVIDLWAPWCGPCRTLGPVLEDAVAATNGDVVLAKVNVDENPEVAKAFQVQSIPAVYAMKDGKVVNGFMGAQGREAIDTFLESLLPDDTEREIAGLLEVGDEPSLRRVLELHADHAEATVALAEVLVADDRGDEALTILGRLPETAESRRVAAMARTGVDEVAVADGLDERLDGLLERVKDDDDARQEYLDVLELMGADDPRTAPYRKLLTAQLF